ncbi:hypothetical protein [Falsiroseomonas sp.]|uniref:hypothetical protein n=1 Tax=Falsiroseomonas sp. TaxID=2870721 RepID=UPI0035691DEA
MIGFRLLLGIDLLVLGVFGWFFLLGVSDGAVSAFNIAQWGAILVVLGGVVPGGRALRRSGRTGMASLLLAAPAILAMSPPPPSCCCC